MLASRQMSLVRSLRLTSEPGRVVVASVTQGMNGSSDLLVPATMNHQNITVRGYKKNADKNKKGRGDYVAYNPNEVEVDKSDKQLTHYLSFLNAPFKKEPPISEEEKERREAILKEYTIQKFKSHNAINHDLTCKGKMKAHALKMLPRNTKLKEHAVFVHDGLFHKDEPSYMYPPELRIPGLDLSRREESNDFEQFG
uniref:Uncharacterized protein n=1 Tax=Entomoneis paludosa TaxID=265537 RepID=A0A7S2YI68_9STRA|mmetsp:Transcript_33697/g.70061  ORF Transcript_33697/g.70061 Transcript_33697/m.70061 type:complete len:197 (+) Transcript_33697:62-652(+)